MNGCISLPKLELRAALRPFSSLWDWGPACQPRNGQCHQPSVGFACPWVGNSPGPCCRDTSQHAPGSGLVGARVWLQAEQSPVPQFLLQGCSTEHRCRAASWWVLQSMGCPKPCSPPPQVPLTRKGQLRHQKALQSKQNSVMIQGNFCSLSSALPGSRRAGAGDRSAAKQSSGSRSSDTGGGSTPRGSHRQPGSAVPRRWQLGHACPLAAQPGPQSRGHTLQLLS